MAGVNIKQLKDVDELVALLYKNEPVSAKMYVELFNKALLLPSSDPRHKEFASELIYQMYYDNNYIATQEIERLHHGKIKQYYPEDRIKGIVGDINKAKKGAWELFEYVPTKDLRSVKNILSKYSEYKEIDWRFRGLEDETLAHLTAKHGCPEMLKAMIRKGIFDKRNRYAIDIDVTDQNGHTPLHLAVLEGHPVVLDVLLKNGADVNKKGSNGRTVLDAVDQILTDGILEGKEITAEQRKIYQQIQNRLLKAGAQYSSEARSNQLAKAVRTGNVKAVEAYLKKNLVYYHDYQAVYEEVARVTQNDDAMAQKVAPALDLVMKHAVKNNMKFSILEGGHMLADETLGKKNQHIAQVMINAQTALYEKEEAGALGEVDARIVAEQERRDRESRLASLSPRERAREIENEQKEWVLLATARQGIDEPKPLEFDVTADGVLAIVDPNSTPNPFAQTDTAIAFEGDDGVTICVQQNVGRDMTHRSYMAFKGRDGNDVDVYAHADRRLNGWQKERRGRGKRVSGVSLTQSNINRIKERLTPLLSSQGYQEKDIDVVIYKLVQANLLYDPNEWVYIDGKRQRISQVFSASKAKGKDALTHRKALALLAGKKDLTREQKTEIAQMMLRVEDAISVDGYAILNVKKGQGRNYDTSRLAGYQKGRSLTEAEQKAIDEKLFNAVAKGDISDINHLLRQGANLNAVREVAEGIFETPLDVAHIAVQQGMKNAGAKTSAELGYSAQPQQEGQAVDVASKVATVGKVVDEHQAGTVSVERGRA